MRFLVFVAFNYAMRGKLKKKVNHLILKWNLNDRYTYLYVLYIVCNTIVIVWIIYIFAKRYLKYVEYENRK